jgi:hypothetical protein
MKRLLMATMLTLAASSTLVWAQTPAANDPHHPADAATTTQPALPSGALSEDQKKTANEILAPHMGMMAMMSGQPGLMRPGQMQRGPMMPGAAMPGPMMRQQPAQPEK